MGIICSCDTSRNSKQSSKTISSINKSQKQNAVPDYIEELEKKFENTLDEIRKMTEKKSEDLKK